MGSEVSLSEILARHPTLAGYLIYNRGNESPEIFHLWSAITAMSGAMGRKFWLPDGLDRYYPNLYTILVGAPAVRKSSAISIVRNILAEMTRVRFAPTDIAGQKQGLLTYLAEDFIEDDTEAEHGTNRNRVRSGLDAAINIDAILETEMAVGSPLDRSSVMVASGEFASFAGIASSPLFTALIELYDCPQEYTYQLKKSAIYVADPVLQILAATTSSSLAQCLPPDIINQGFMSRVILVHSADSGKRLPRRFVGADEDINRVKSALEWAYWNKQGEMTETPDAMKFIDDLYMSDEAIKRMIDPRLQYYANRRHAHLRKVSMIFAATEQRLEITLDDMVAAHELLKLTEARMPDALGEYGLSVEHRVKQRIVDYLVAQDRRIDYNELYGHFQSDCPRRSTFATIITELLDSKKIHAVKDEVSDVMKFTHIHYGVSRADKVRAYLSKTRSIQ